MATAPQMNPQLSAIGAIGGAISAGQDAKSYKAMLGQQTQQLKDQIAFQRDILEKQKVLRDQEVIRQQMLARAAGDAFANSKAQFTNVEQDIGAKSKSIADTFRAVLNQQGPTSVAPAAKGPVADLEASLRAAESTGISDEAARLAAAQAFGQTMTDKGYALNDQGTLASLLRNFSSGSQRASSAEILSKEGKLFQPEIQRPQPSALGDLFVGLSTLGLMNQQKPNEAPSKYALDFPKTNSGNFSLNPNSGVGLRINGVRAVGD